MRTGLRREGESKRDYMLRVWHNMTPEARDYDRFVARSIPQGATWFAETEGGRRAEAERDRLLGEAEYADGCSCHINPPCGYCMRQSDDDENALTPASSSTEGVGR